MKKLSFLLAIILLLSACFITACKKNEPQNNNPDTTTAPVQDNPVVDASISAEQLENYEIIYARNSSKEIPNHEVVELFNTIREVFGVTLDQRTDLYYEGVESLKKGQYEILIGHTNREESSAFLSSLKWDDYGYGMVGDKLVIAGKNEDGTIAALRAFLEYINKNEGGEVFFSNVDQLIVSKQYPFNNITINSLPADHLSIVCNTEGFGGVAEVIREAIIDACGIAVPIITDDDVKAGDKLIIVGESEHVPQEVLAASSSANVEGNDYYFGTDENTLWLNAKTAAGYLSAATAITKQLSDANANSVVLASGKHNGEDVMAVMSFNLMAGKEEKRINSVVDSILKYRPAVVGVQEATDNWMNILRARLKDTYTIVGSGRNADGHDEHSAILYLTEEFDCLKSGTKWLSDTPDTAGSKFAESHYTRIMTYVHLSRKSDGKQFLHVNTHLDYGSSDAEEQIKVAQMQVIFDEIAKLNLDVPTIITGDFNATVGSPVYDKIIAEGYSEAASHIPAEDRAPTYHGLMGTTGEPRHIDFIFAKGLANDNLYRICTERVDNENVSDHYPIFSILSFLIEE